MTTVRAGLILYLLVFPVVSAFATSKESEAVSSSVSALLTRLQAAYQPFAGCVSEQRQVVGDASLAAEFVASGGLVDLETVASQMLPEEHLLRKQAQDSRLSDVERAASLLQGLRSYGLEHVSPADNFAIHRTYRHVLADVLLAKFSPIDCEIPETLCGLMREARDLDFYASLVDAYIPLMDCTAEWMESGGAVAQVPTRAVEMGLATEFSRLVVLFLGENRPAVISAQLDGTDEIERMRRLLEGLAVYSVDSSNVQPFGQWTRRLLAKVETRRLISQVMGLDCKSSEKLLLLTKSAYDEYL